MFDKYLSVFVWSCLTVGVLCGFVIGRSWTQINRNKRSATSKQQQEDENYLE